MKFKVGDLVRVKDSTNDQDIPESRCGLIMERYAPRPNEKHMFHEMFLEKVSEEEHEKED